MIHDLGHNEQATIVLLLLSGNELPDPVDDIPESLNKAYGVDVSDIRRSLKTLKGSLARLSIIGQSKRWQVHHPTMIDAMHVLLRQDEAMLDLYLEAAPVDIVLRDCHTRERENSIFVPTTLYEVLAGKIFQGERERICEFFIEQTAEFRAVLVDNFAAQLANTIALSVGLRGKHEGLRLLSLLVEEREDGFSRGAKEVKRLLPGVIWKLGCWEPLEEPEFRKLLGRNALRTALLICLKGEIEILPDFVEFVKHAELHFDEAVEIQERIARFNEVLDNLEGYILTKYEVERIHEAVNDDVAWVAEELEKYLYEWGRHLDLQATSWQEERGFFEETDESCEFGIFSDVDE